MKTQYFRRRNALLSGSVWPIGAALVVLVVVVLLIRVFAPDVLSAVAKPLWHAGDAASKGVASVSTPFQNIVTLQAERDALQQENAALHAQVAVLSAQVQGTATLAPGISAGVLARPPVSPYDTLVVGAGEQQGIAQGAIAYAPGGVPVGVVQEVSAQTARVQLYSAPGVQTEGWVGEERIAITLMGRGAGAFAASLARDSGVAVGDVVYAPGPGALPVGTVMRIDSDPSSPRSQVFIQPLVNIFSLTWVSFSL